MSQQESPRQQEPVSLNCGHWSPTFRAVTVAPLCFTFPVWENLHADPNLHRPESLYWKQSGAASDSLDPRPPPVAGPPPRTRAVLIPPWENLHSLPNLHCPLACQGSGTQHVQRVRERWLRGQRSSVLVSGVPWGPRDPVSGGRGPRENWILYKFDRKLAVGGPRKDGRGPRATKTY